MVSNIISSYHSDRKNVLLSVACSGRRGLGLHPYSCKISDLSSGSVAENTWFIREVRGK